MNKSLAVLGSFVGSAILIAIVIVKLLDCVAYTEPYGVWWYPIFSPLLSGIVFLAGVVLGMCTLFGKKRLRFNPVIFGLFALPFLFITVPLAVGWFGFIYIPGFGMKGYRVIVLASYFLFGLGLVVSLRQRPE